MSEWYEPEDDDISFDLTSNQVDIYVKQNDFGSVYISLSFDQITKLAEKIRSNNGQRNQSTN